MPQDKEEPENQKSADQQEQETSNKPVKLIIKNNIRKAIRSKIANVAEEVETALNDKVLELLDTAISRAKANNRKTLHARDL